MSSTIKRSDTPARSETVGAPRFVACLLACGIVAIPYVFFSTFSYFFWFDDEGTLMSWFQSWLDGHRMYDEIFSLYGPLYNEVYGLLYVGAQLPLSHMSNRFVSALLWLTYTAGFATLCYRLTRSTIASIVSYVITLVWLAPLMHTPGHPEELGLVLMVSALLVTPSTSGRPAVARIVALGAIIAGLCLVKINFGTFVGLPIITVLLGATRPPAMSIQLQRLAGAALLLLPAAIMVIIADQGWVRAYWLFATLVIGATLFSVSGAPRSPVLGFKHWMLMALAGILVVAAVVGGMMVAGSSGRAILNATLLQNANFIRNWSIPLRIGPQGLLMAAFSALCAALYHATADRPRYDRARALGIVALKGLCVFMGLALFAWPGQLFQAVVPFCWLLTVGPSRGSEQGLVRNATALVGAAMSLYAFPVGGGQVFIAAVVVMALLPVLALDAWTGLLQLGLVRSPLGRIRPATAVLAGVLIVGGIVTARSAQVYVANAPLDLPGTQFIRIDPGYRDDLRWVTAQLQTCSASYSMPGQLSFAFWTGHRLLTPINVNGILNFVSAEQQKSIVQALSLEPDLCVVFHPGLLKFFDRGQVQTDPPLLHYIQSEFSATAERGGYTILKRIRH